MYNESLPRGTGLSTANTPVKETEISRELYRLESEIDFLQKTIGDLSNKLEPVFVDRPTDVLKGEETRETSTQIGGRIRGFSDRVKMNIGTLQRLIDGLEI